MPIKNLVTEAGQLAYDRFHFSEAVESGGLLFCSGIIGTGPKGRVPEDITEEFRNAWQGVGALLAAAGLSYEHIVECTTYHVQLQKHLPTFMSVRDQFLSEPWPAWTAIGITELAIPGAHAEIRITAELPKHSKK